MSPDGFCEPPHSGVTFSLSSEEAAGTCLAGFPVRGTCHELSGTPQLIVNISLFFRRSLQTLPGVCWLCCPGGSAKGCGVPHGESETSDISQLTTIKELNLPFLIMQQIRYFRDFYLQVLLF